jgi:hypothetical protein
VRTYAAVFLCLVLIATVGVAYNQCSKKPCGKDVCPTPCPGTCPATSASTSCSQAASCSAAAACPSKDACGTCDNSCADGCDNCPLKGSDKVTKIAGAVRYVRGTNSAVKVASGDQAVLLRISDACGQCASLRTALAALKRGQEVNAEYRSCAKTGRHYLVSIAPAG